MRALAIVTGALLAAGVSTANAQLVTKPPPAVWQGDLFILTASAACSGSGVVPNNFYRSVYRPNIALPPKGQAPEALALSTQRSEFILEATGKTLRGKANASGTDVGSRAQVSTAATTVDLVIVPAIIKANTLVVQISGTIRNLFNETGCTVTVRGALGLRPAD
jgi:hypothetical protein